MVHLLDEGVRSVLMAHCPKPSRVPHKRYVSQARLNLIERRNQILVSLREAKLGGLPHVCIYSEYNNVRKEVRNSLLADKRAFFDEVARLAQEAKSEGDI